MKRIVIATALVLFASAYQAQAASCEAPLNLTCQGTFLASGKTVVTGTATDRLADENWDEPSLANCAATVYLTNAPHTSVRIYAKLENSQVNYTSVASQVYKNDQNQTVAYYSNYLENNSKPGTIVNLGTIHLANPVSYGREMIMVTDVAVTCTVR